MTKGFFIGYYIFWILLSGVMLAFVTKETLDVVFSDNPFWFMPIGAPIVMIIALWIVNDFIKTYIYQELVATADNTDFKTASPKLKHS